MITFKTATIKDINLMMDIANSWENHQKISGHTTTKEELLDAIVNGDLPPVKNASIDNYSLKLIYHNDNCIGYFDHYNGFPDNETVWISIFIIHKDYRKKGFGKTAINQFISTIPKQSYQSVGIGVDLKNFSGMKFWTSIGFNQIVKVVGDDTFSEDTFATALLKRSIAKQ